MRIGLALSCVVMCVAFGSMSCGGNDAAPTCTGVGCSCVDTACTCVAGADCKTECGEENCSLDCTSAAKCNGNTNGALTLEWDSSGRFGCDVWSPLTRWTLDDVIAIHRHHDLRPNPLYLLGAARVGCWPCIFARKAELRLIALNPGSREYIRASVDYDSIGQNEPERFNLVLQRVRTAGSELIEDQEIFRRLSMNAQSSRFVTTALLESRLARVAGPLPVHRPDRAAT